MNDVSRPQSLIGNDVFAPDGARIGRVGNVYVDDSTHQPEWVTVRTGLFGMKESFVPLAGASTKRDRITVEVSRDKVRDAPRVDAEHGHLSDEQGRDLYDHYELQATGGGLQPTGGGPVSDGSAADSVPSPRGTCPAEAISVPGAAESPDTEPSDIEPPGGGEPDAGEPDAGSRAAEIQETVGAGTVRSEGGRHHSSESSPPQYRVGRPRSGHGRHRRET